MRSSYKDNGYADFFAGLAKIYQPKLIVECGVLDGYSLLAMAKAAPKATVKGIDLFEDYEHKHGSMDQIYSEAYDEGIRNIELQHADAFKAHTQFHQESIDILHLDISNDGNKLWDLFDVWQDKVKKEKGIIVFEGGSKERDNVSWMLRYGKMSIRKFKFELEMRKKWEVLTLTPFPSVTICRRIK